MGVLKSGEPTGFLAFAPAFAGTNWADVNRLSSKIARTAEEESCLWPPVWFRLCQLRVYLSLNKGHGLSDVFEPANAMRKLAERR